MFKLKMKRLILTTFLIASGLAAAAQSSDTTFIKRPYYLGITAGYSRFGSYAHDGTPFDIMNPPAANQYYEEWYYDKSAGIQFSFPFLRKWECETDLEYIITTGWHQRSTYWKRTNPQPETIYWNASASNRVEGDWRLRSFFSYELMRRSKFAVNAGAGGWYSTMTQVGAEAGVKCYYSVSNDVVFQLGVNAGYARFSKLYGAVRVSVLLQGTRTYRARPHKYYVRTYEAGE